MKRNIKLLAILTLCCVVATGCGDAAGNAKSLWMPENEIISYDRIDSEKTVLVLGEFAGIDTTQIAQAIEDKFPTVDIVVSKRAAGQEPDHYLRIQNDNHALPDIVFTTSKLNIPEALYDLSGESFISRYHLTALNSMSVDGKIYQIPCADTVAGIWYNKTLFEEHNWDVPQTRDEFYALCEEISKTGIRAFAPNLKYSGILHNMIIGLSHDELFENVEKINQFNAFTAGDATSKDLFEPALATLQDLYKRKIICDDDFSSSITKTRQALYAGEVAMMPYGLEMDYHYRDEKPDCELGLFGYPTDVPGTRWLRMSTGCMIGVSSASMEDDTKKEILLEIFDFLSTNEGQQIITGSISGVSNVNGYSSGITELYPEIESCLKNGSVYYMNDFGSDDWHDMYLQLATGQTTIDKVTPTLDEYMQANKNKGFRELPVIGTAEDTFSVLETSMFIADTMRKNTDAQIALIPNLSYFKGNLAQIYKGDFSLAERFYIKGLGAEDCLTTYNITGKNLKELLEHPYINGAESNILYAFSGLQMEYAPWAPAAENVRKITLSDGKEIDDSATYTVAAWKTTIDDRYLSGIAKEHPELGNNIQVMKTEISASESIAPAKDDRIKLLWDDAE